MKNPFLHIVFSLWISFLLFACGSSTETKIDTSTKDAEKVIDQLHDLLGKHKFEETHALFSDKFKAVNNWKQVHQIFEAADTLGKIKKRAISRAEATPGPEGSIYYDMIYEVTRTKINSTEQYFLQKVDGQVKILKFKVLAVPYIE